MLRAGKPRDACRGLFPNARAVKIAFTLTLFCAKISNIKIIFGALTSHQDTTRVFDISAHS